MATVFDEISFASCVRSLQNKRVAVIGAGVSNTPLITALLQGGCAVTVCDKASRSALGEKGDTFEALGAAFRLGEGYLSGLADEDFDVIFRTPGLLPSSPELVKAWEKGCLVTSEMELFFALCPCRILAVTGSDGKTTTTTVIAELLKAEGYTVHIGGNIGRPLLTEVDDMSPEDFAVLELSSFQLHSMTGRANVAVVTNVSPNHLDVHPSYADYIEAKKSVFLAQQANDVLVLNLDNAITASFAPEAKGEVRLFSRKQPVENGAYAADGQIYLAENGQSRALMRTDEIFIPGVHNVENYLAAFCAVGSLVSEETMKQVARSFTGVEHRLEVVRTLRGVTYVNDSIASSPTRTIAGLRSYEDRGQKPILIAGGYDKKIPFDELGPEICRTVKALFLCGATAEKIRASVLSAPEYDPDALPVTVLDDFSETVRAASALAEEGDIVLLSPACASFDRFQNFVERGRAFKKIVNELE